MKNIYTTFIIMSLIFTAHFLSETGRLNEAAQLYEQAIIKSPQDFELVFNAANTLR